jgi:RNA polymerase sigma-70 factor (ECF subfamily)
VCLDETQANDITQNVVLKIIKNIHKFEMKSEFSTWYYRIAYNESITFLNKIKHHVEYDEVENYLIDENTDFYNIDKQIEQKDINQSIN